MNTLMKSLSALGVSATLVSPNLSAQATTNSVPELKGIKDTTIHKGQDFHPLNGIKAYDKEDGDLTDQIKVNGYVDTNQTGTYKFEYVVTDSDGAERTSVRYVQVK